MSRMPREADLASEHAAPLLVRSTSMPMPELPLLREVTGDRVAAQPGNQQEHEGDAARSSQRPVLVRGFSGGHDDMRGVAALVAAAMAKLDNTSGWGSADPQNVQVTNNSGQGGSQTYKITCEGCVPQSVALHSRTDMVAKLRLSEQRMEAAASQLSSFGLTPARLAHGGDWFIEPWEGEVLSSKSVEIFAEVGRLVARIHGIPPDWFDEWREKLCKAHPSLRGIPLLSHVWLYTCRYEEWLEPVPEEFRNVYFAAELTSPTSLAGKRLVTTHGDLHGGNMLQTETGIKCIDLELTHVTNAAMDLGKVCNHFCRTKDDKRVFLEAYLTAAGLPATSSDVDEIYLDAEIQWCTTLWSWLAPEKATHWMPLFDFYRNAMEAIRNEPDIREDVLGGKSVEEVIHEHPKLLSMRVPFAKAWAEEQFSKLPEISCSTQQEEAVLEQDKGEANCKLVHRQFNQATISFWLAFERSQQFSSRGELAAIALSSGCFELDAFSIGIGREGLMFQNELNVPAPEQRTKGGRTIHEEVPADGQWHNFAMAYDAESGVMKSYVDGCLATCSSFAVSFPIRLSKLCFGAACYDSVPMDSYQNFQEKGKLLVITISGHSDDSYNGSYIQQSGLCNNKPFFRNKTGRFLKKYDAGGGGGPDWSLDHRQPQDLKDWCGGGWYDSPPGEDLRLGTYEWSCGLLTILWCEKGMQNDDTIKAVPRTEAKVTYIQPFPDGQLACLSLFSRCLEDTELLKLYEEQKINATRPPLSVSATPVLEKIDLDGLMTWKEHKQHAANLGGCLPTRIDLVYASVGTDEPDVWIPVSREDGEENDWVQITDCAGGHPKFISHKDAYGCPGWGDNTDPQGLEAGWRVLYFYVKRRSMQSSPWNDSSTSASSDSHPSESSSDIDSASNS